MTPCKQIELAWPGFGHRETGIYNKYQEPAQPKSKIAPANVGKVLLRHQTATWSGTQLGHITTLTYNPTTCRHRSKVDILILVGACCHHLLLISFVHKLHVALH